MLQTLNIPSSPLPEVPGAQPSAAVSAPGDAGERAEFAQLLQQAKAVDGDAGSHDGAVPPAQDGRGDLRARHGAARSSPEARSHDVRRARPATEPVDADCEPADLTARLAKQEPSTDADAPAVDTLGAAPAQKQDDPSPVTPDAALAPALMRHTEPLPAADARAAADTLSPAGDERSTLARLAARSGGRDARMPTRHDAQVPTPIEPGASASAAPQTTPLQAKDASAFDGALRAGGRATASPLFDRASIDGTHASAQATAFARELQQASPVHLGAGNEATLQAAPDDAAFAPALGAQVTLWVKDGVQEARLHLHPAELGPVSVQIALDGQAAHVDFTAAVAATRDSIEQSLPSLAAALRESGFTLAGGGVFGGRAGSGDTGRERTPEGRGTRGTAAIVGAEGDGEAEPTAPRRWARSLVDVYA